MSGMTTGDILGLVFSYLFAFSMLLLVEAVRRWRNYPTEFTRKLVHIGAGMWIWAVLLLFDHWWFAIIPPATFIVFNSLFLRFRVFSAMDPDKGATPSPPSWERCSKPSPLTAPIISPCQSAWQSCCSGLVCDTAPESHALLVLSG